MAHIGKEIGFVMLRLSCLSHALLKLFLVFVHASDKHQQKYESREHNGYSHGEMRNVYHHIKAYTVQHKNVI